jgi:glycosyltransferase involved in cell wall biosynthesis
MSLGLADQVVFISDTVQSWFQQFVRFRRPAQLIPNGVDIHIFSYVSSDEQDTLRQTLNLPVDRPVILYVGRFVEKKGIRLLRDVVRHTSSWHWVMIGRPGDEDPAMWGFDHITVLPPKSQRELRSYYGAADIVVLPSIGEGFPLVAQEAMACGTPVLLAEETARAIPQAQHLFVTTSPDAPTLHTRLATALSNPDALRELGYQACIFVQQNWNWVTVAHQYCYFFETLLKSNASVRQPVE